MFFLFILIILFLLFYAIHTSKIGITISSLNFNSEINKTLNKECKIEIYLLLFKKIKILKKDLKKMNEIKFDKNEVDISYLKNKDLKIRYLELIKEINVEIASIDLKIGIGTEDAAITAIIVGILSIILGNIIKKPKYQIIPQYLNKNILKIKLDGIFYINLMQYIYKLVKKRLKREKKTLLKINV